MTMLHTDPAPSIAWPDSDAALLFAGGMARQDLAAHRSFFGDAALAPSEQIAELVDASGLEGRGGAGFPLARKLSTARRATGEPIVIVNISESEPASRKDALLGCLRPHLLLDGAAAISRSIGSRTVVLRIHEGSPSLESSLRAALDERSDQERDQQLFSVSLGPARYVAGESSAVAAALAGFDPLPLHKTLPLATVGPSGRPTIVVNAETAAQVAALCSVGLERWRAAGPSGSTGTRLLTIAGGVAAPHSVLELTGPSSFGELLRSQGVVELPEAVLVGGYAGRWLEGGLIWGLEVDDEALSPHGASLGCGVIGIVPAGRCALAEVARLARYLADESAGQCGPCVLGLPEVAAIAQDLASGKAGRRHLRRLLELAAEIDGRNACSHPDATLAMLRSATSGLPTELDRHLGGKGCGLIAEPALFATQAEQW